MTERQSDRKKGRNIEGRKERKTDRKKYHKMEIRERWEL